MTDAAPRTEADTKAEFLRRAHITDHPFSRTPEPCCGEDPSRHLGYGSIPWTLPTVDEMRALLDD